MASSGAASLDKDAKPLRLLMTTDSVGGVWQYSLDLLRELGQITPVEVLLLNLGPEPTPVQQAEARAIPGLALECGPFALEWMDNPWGDVQASGQWLLQKQAEWRPDVVHLNGYVHAALPWDRPTLVVAHSCVLSWWEAVHGTNAPPEWDEYARQVRTGLLAARGIVAPSQFMRRALSKHYGLQPETIRVIHNFSSTTETKAQSKEAIALAVGRMWDPAKNLALLRRLSVGTAMPIQIAGPASDLESSLQYLGHLEHEALLERMRLAGVFLHPALYEPFGLAVLEAARQSCCLLLADIPALRELWEGAAVFLPPDAPELWVAEIERLAQDSALLQEWGERSRLHAERYQTANSITSYWKLYRALIERGVAAPAGKDAAA